MENNPEKHFDKNAQQESLHKKEGQIGIINENKKLMRVDVTSCGYSLSLDGTQVGEFVFRDIIDKIAFRWNLIEICGVRCQERLYNVGYVSQLEAGNLSQNELILKLQGELIADKKELIRLYTLVLELKGD